MFLYIREYTIFIWQGQSLPDEKYILWLGWWPYKYWWISPRVKTDKNLRSWWRHQMETFSALLAICVGNSPVAGEFPTQRPVTRCFDVLFDLRLNKRFSKQSWGWFFRRHRTHYAAIVMLGKSSHIPLLPLLATGDTFYFYYFVFMIMARYDTYSNYR